MRSNRAKNDTFQPRGYLDAQIDLNKSKSEGRVLNNEDRLFHSKQFVSNRVVGNSNDREKKFDIGRHNMVEQKQASHNDLERSPYEMEMIKKQQERSFQKAQSSFDSENERKGGNITTSGARRSRSMDLRGGSYEKSFEQHEVDGRDTWGNNQGIDSFRKNEEVLDQLRHNDIYHSSPNHRRHTMQHTSFDNTHTSNSGDVAFRRDGKVLDQQRHDHEQFNIIRGSSIQHTVVKNSHPSNKQASFRDDPMMKVQSYNERQTHIHPPTDKFRRHTVDLTANVQDTQEHMNEEHRRRTMQLGSGTESLLQGSRYSHKPSSRTKSERILPGGTNKRENFQPPTRRAHSDPRNGVIAQSNHDQRREFIADERKNDHFVIKEMSPWLEHSRDPAHRRRSPPGPHDEIRGKPHYNPMEDVEKFEFEEIQEEKRMIQAKEENHNPIHRVSIKSHGDLTIVNAVDEMKNICDEFALFFNSQDANGRSNGKPRKQSDILARLEDLMSTKQKLPVCKSFPKDLLQIIKLLPGNDKCCDCAMKFQSKLSFGSPTYGCLLCGPCALRHINTRLNIEEMPTRIISFDDGEWTLPHMIGK